MAKISQNISSESLFHFIKRIEWLLEILDNRSFQARYVYENVPEANFKAAIAMKCFCDIPLGVIKKHMSDYGSFGIGIRKTFAKKEHITPVIYFHDNSDLYFRYISVTSKDDIFKNRFSLLPYFKADSRISIDSKGKKQMARFYDEREWRYIPGDAELIDCSNLTDAEIMKKLSKINNDISKTRSKFLLPFEYSDVTYIFVKFEKDIDNVINTIKKISASPIQQDRLISKIVTSRQIEMDF